ncbi:uncharacterized protein BKA55DRAFT_684020 [Fusarium redolens]|uniref:Uncharacterized protein n=1 Tax=Fusarium redolens TaxID=48865 RepID=A0A9P9R3J7_FUSRE|nr:uncharacterized protein BKA55DRAFT_684020 [Fusarium redolens]KAH7266736.1 hypothetical protein BKA55DRAFT_684020 [Fusarium redolens]
MISTTLTRLRPMIAPRNLYTRGAARRTYSNKAPSPVSQFYRTFTRPVAKTLLIAVFTYQLAYWTWVKLETDEIRAEREATIEKLETTIKDYDAATKANKA